MSTRFYKVNNLEIKAGNHKLGIDTLIYSLGSATNCIAEKMGLCSVAGVCYAKVAEIQYPNVLPYRERQAIYFDSTPIKTIRKDITELLSKKGKVLKNIKYLRLNESGDFKNQSQLNKALSIAKFLYTKFNIITYTYTCRKDLNFPDKEYFLIKGSSCPMPNGETRVFECREKVPSTFAICPGSCYKCNLCKRPNKKDVAFIVHGHKGIKKQFKAMEGI